MERMVNKILKILRDHVNQNNIEIRYNQDDINRILSEQLQGKKQNDLDFKYSLNQELLDENADIINLQLAITEFMEKYGHLFAPVDETEDDHDIKNDVEADDDSSCFQLTVKGKMNFDRNHPQFNNPSFFNLLLDYYQEKEDYEMCEHLMNMIKSHS